MILLHHSSSPITYLSAVQRLARVVGEPTTLVLYKLQFLVVGKVMPVTYRAYVQVKSSEVVDPPALQHCFVILSSIPQDHQTFKPLREGLSG